MDDLISRQAAIDALNMLFKKQVTQFGYEGYEKADEKTQLVCDGISESIECVMNLPSAQPTVDPQQAIRDAYKHGKSKGIKKGLAMAQRMKGRWIHDGCDIPHGVDWMHCSVCGRREPHVPAAMTNYCPGCGAEMETEGGRE